jgi:glutathione S-transferase
MKLYYFPASTFARRVRVALLEKNISCELIELNLPAGQHKESWYAAPHRAGAWGPALSGG